MKKIFVDVETTGTDPQKHAIIQLAGAIVVDGEVDWFDYKLKPFEGAEVDEEAIKVTGLTDYKEFPDPSGVYSDFLSKLDGYVDKYDRSDKFLFIAYNATFDAQFLRQFFYRNNNKYYGSYFFYPPIDVMQLVALDAVIRGKRPDNFKLSTVADFYDIKLDGDHKYHDARADIEITMKIFDKLHNLYKEAFDVYNNEETSV